MSKQLAKIPIFLLSLAGVLTAFFEWATEIVVVQFLCMSLLALFFALNSRYFYGAQVDFKRLLIYFFVYQIFIVFHSLFVAKSYEQWSYLVNVYLPFLILPCFAILSADIKTLGEILRMLLQITLPTSLFFLMKGPGDKLSNTVYIAYVAAICLFILMIPMLRRRWQILVVIISVISFLWDTDSRSNILNISMAYALLFLSVILNKIQSRSLLSLFFISIKNIFLYLPLVLLALGLSGVFNIFEVLESGQRFQVIELSGGAGRYLTTDSRTGIYMDAFNNLSENNSWLFGSSATVMYATQLISIGLEYEAGRLGGSESGFLGMLTFGGVIYASLFFSLCYQSSKIAMQNSNNTLIKLVGLFVAYKWFFSFIELPLIMNFSWVVLFIAMGMTFNRHLCSMTDAEIFEYFRKL